MTKTNEIDTSLRAAIGAIAGGAALDDALVALAESVVARLGAGSCKIWLVKNGDMCDSCPLADSCRDRTMCLHLKASSPGIGVELPRVPLVVFRDRVAARGGAGRAGEGVAGPLLFGADEVEMAGGDAYSLVPLQGPGGVLGLLGVLRRRPLAGAESDELRGYADAAVVAVRIADLTSRQQRAEMRREGAARELASARELVDAVLAGASGYSVVAEDLEGKVTLFSDGAREAFGYEPDEMVGRGSADALFAPEEVLSGRVARIFEEAMRSGRCDTTVIRMRKSGERFTSRASFFLRRDAEGDPAGMIVVERGAAEADELERARAEADELRARAERADELEELLAIRVETIRELRRKLEELSAPRPAPAAPEPDEPPPFVADASEGLVFAEEPEVAEAARAALAEAGRSGAVFADAAGALEFARSVRPGVAVVDLGAAGALDLLAAFAAAPYAPRVVALGDEASRAAALARGAFRFVARRAAPPQSRGGALARALEEASGPAARLLVAVDDPDERREIGALLEHPAYDAVFAASWSAARERLDAERFDAVVVDLCMPGASGFALLDVTRGAHPPVVLVAARELGHAERRAVDRCAAVLSREILTRERLLAALDAAV